MRRLFKILAWTFGTLVALALVGVIVISSVDWNRAKPWVEARVGGALGRPFAIRGPLALHWKRDGIVFRPYVTASDVHVGPLPGQADSPELAAVEGANLDLELLPLLARRVSLPNLSLHAPTVHLERDDQGRGNWTLPQGGASGWSVHLGKLTLDHGRIEYVDAGQKTALHVDLTPLAETTSLEDAIREQETESEHAAAARIGRAATEKVKASARQRGASPQRTTRQSYAFRFIASGRWHGAEVSAIGRIGDVFALRDATHPFPLQARGTIGGTHVALVGTVTDPTSPDAIDVRLWLTGSSLDQLYPIFGIVLPASPPYATDGHLTGRFVGGGVEVTYENYTAHLGGSDLHGTLAYTPGKDRPLLHGDATSERLRFADLAPVVGAGPAPPPGPSAAPRPARVLPDAPLPVERWRTMDADVEFAAQHVERDAGALPLSDLKTHVVLRDGTLQLDPLRFALAQGSVAGAITVDGAKSPPPGAIKLRLRDVKLDVLLADLAKRGDLKLGEADGDLELAGHGTSVADLLGTSDGHVTLLLEGGWINRSTLEIAGLNVLNFMLTKLFGDEPLRIRCAAAALTAKDGVLDADVFTIDTETTVVVVDGSVNLRDESLDLSVKPQSKKLRLLTLRTPLHMRGTLSHPDIGVDKGPLLARGAGAVALAAIAPPAALAALIAPSRERDHACKATLDTLHASAPVKAARK